MWKQEGDENDKITDVSYKFLLHKFTKFQVCFYTIADLITLTLLGFKHVPLCSINHSNCFHHFVACINLFFN